MLTGRLVVGLEDDADGSLRVYVDHRSTGIHTHVADRDVVAEFRRAWGSSIHLTANIPDAALCDCPTIPAGTTDHEQQETTGGPSTTPAASHHDETREATVRE